MAITGVIRPGHVQLRVLDIEAALKHYRDVLGLIETARDPQGRIYLKAWDEHDHHSVVLREADSVEAVHQLRVAVRRLRSAVSTFADVADDDHAEAIKAELKWLAGACDEARDLDVFAESAAALVDPTLDLSPLAPVVEAARARAHAKACAAVASGRFRDLVLDTTAWVETGAWLSMGGKAHAKRRDMDADRHLHA